MRPGRLIAVVGPSGVGKDSLISGLAAARPALRVVRRTITRAADPRSEAHVPATEAEFLALRAAGAFCLSWQAHGLWYGIPHEIRGAVAAGQDAVANLSRAALPEAAQVFGRLVVLQVTAGAATLARRLAARGREDAADIRARLARADLPLPEGLTAARITNDGPIGAAVAQALEALDAAEAQPRT